MHSSGTDESKPDAVRATTAARVHLVSWPSGGHREGYDAALIALLEEHGVTLTRESRGTVADFYPTMDDDIPGFLWRALRNAVLGRRTVGLFFRTRQCYLRGKAKYRLKAAFFVALRLIPGVRTLSILPFAVEPGITPYVDGWINDPMCWDLRYSGIRSNPIDAQLIEDVRQQARGRRIVVALGRQDHDKGFGSMAQLWAREATLRDEFLFVSAGRVAEECAADAQAFVKAGGYLVDRVVSDSELLALYDAASLVWTCYNPSYDQASGIFGRAIQLGRPTITRENSYLSRLAPYLGHPTLAISPNDTEKVAKLLVAWRVPHLRLADVDAGIDQMRLADVRTLIEAFGVSVSPDYARA